MGNRIRAAVSRYLDKRSISSGDEIYLHLILLVAYTFAAFVHAFLLVLMSLAQAVPLIIANLVSLSLYVFVGYRLVLKGRYFAAGMLVSLEVLVYSVVMVLLIGSNNYTLFYPLLLIVMQIIIPYADAKVRGIFVAVLFFLCVFFPVFETYYIPPHDIGVYNMVLRYFNIAAGVLGIILELLIGNVIRNFISAVDDEKMEVFENQAHTDQLTGLFNRRYAEIMFNRIRSDKSLSEMGWCVAMLDIDDFKKVNDTYGHAVGDEVLIFLSNFLKRNLRKNDNVFRWGGEEFLILLEDIENQLCWKVLEKIRMRLEETPIPTSAGDLSITVTIGVAALDVSDVNRCIETSDARLYEGKQTGKNKVVR